MSEHRRYDGLKRAMDVTVAGAALIATAPIQLVIAGVVLAAHGGPVLFKQERPGRDGKPFTLLKFRTMLQPTPERQSDEDRLTPIGKAMRAASLDELPTLLNVVKGDMALVGPRPLLCRYLDRYTAEQARRHEVRPGITGLAQTRGRNSLSWEDKFRLDVEYVDKRSLALDLRILLETVRTVLAREGINQEGHVTMPEFVGTAQESVDVQ